MKAIWVLGCLAGAGLCSCGSVQSGSRSASPEPSWRVDEEVYQTMERGEGAIEISLQDQRLTLRDDMGRTVIETDCSTGIDGRETPTGTFRIKEMIVDKRSNKYGKYVSKETGEVIVEKSWEVSQKPPGTEYLGIAMPYWMRLTWDGVGIHVGEFPKGYRTSFGCIRMPEEVQPLIYERSRLGMPVTVRL
ncbi:L,D-transpeptidase family protein [Roseibacillus persicicus]|uniref:L,D-transpeptidase family protein n=1 Tax=Roseibacillus persicicus TaxID=454148 RepID=UPI00398B9875